MNRLNNSDLVLFANSLDTKYINNNQTDLGKILIV